MRKLLVMICALVVWDTSWAESQLKIIPMHHLFAQDILPSIEPLVGDGGMASAVGTNLLVRASEDRMAAIEQVIALLDVERRTLRITISRSFVDETESGAIGIAGSIRRGDLAVQMPDRHGRVVPGAVVQLGKRDTSTSERRRQFVSVLEGERAFISAGQSVPFTETWFVLLQQYARVQESVRFRDISTGFTVRPRIIGAEIELEITPRVGNYAHGTIEFQQLATMVRVLPGQWFDLGGVMQSRDEVSREILAGSSASSQRSAQFWIHVE